MALVLVVLLACFSVTSLRQNNMMREVFQAMNGEGEQIRGRAVASRLRRSVIGKLGKIF